MAEHLIGLGPAPWEYVELVLCRDVYHCTPDQLRQIPASQILVHLTCMRIEQQNARHDAQWRAMR